MRPAPCREAAAWHRSAKARIVPRYGGGRSGAESGSIAAEGNAMPERLVRRALLAAAGATCLARGAIAQTEGWPARPVRIVVPFTPGGSNDAIARPLAERLQARFGQPFLVENRPGAGSAVGVVAVAQSATDGHTLLMTTSSIAAIGPVQGTG